MSNKDKIAAATIIMGYAATFAFLIWLTTSNAGNDMIEKAKLTQTTKG